MADNIITQTLGTTEAKVKLKSQPDSEYNLKFDVIQNCAQDMILELLFNKLHEAVEILFSRELPVLDLTRPSLQKESHKRERNVR